MTDWSVICRAKNGRAQACLKVLFAKTKTPRCRDLEPALLLRVTEDRPACNGERSAFGVAGEGADHAVMPAVLVAILQREVFRLAKLRRDRVAVRTAGIVTVDRKRSAGTLHDPDHLALSVRAFG